MKSFTKVGFKGICATLSRQKTELFYKTFLPELLNLEGQWEVAIFEIYYPSMYQKVAEGRFFFFDKKFSKSSKIYNLEPSLYLSITDFVEAVNTLIQERHNQNEKCNTVKVSRRTRKVEISLAIERSGPAFICMDLGHISGSNVFIEFGVMLGGKEPHKPGFAFDMVRIHSLRIYRDLIGYNIAGDTKVLLLRFFSFNSKFKSGHFITTGQYMNHKTISNVHFRPLLENSRYRIHIDSRDTSAEKCPFYLSLSLVLFWCSGKPPTIISNLKDVTTCLLEVK